MPAAVQRQVNERHCSRWVLCIGRVHLWVLCLGALKSAPLEGHPRPEGHGHHMLLGRLGQHVVEDIEDGSAAEVAVLMTHSFLESLLRNFPKLR
jgi:hypothetical protein